MKRSISDDVYHKDFSCSILLISHLIEQAVQYFCSISKWYKKSISGDVYHEDFCHSFLLISHLIGQTVQCLL